MAYAHVNRQLLNNKHSSAKLGIIFHTSRTTVTNQILRKRIAKRDLKSRGSKQQLLADFEDYLNGFSSNVQDNRN
jgi:hypothetical protein